MADEDNELPEAADFRFPEPTVFIVSFKFE
jgi:hypothetical protein